MMKFCNRIIFKKWRKIRNKADQTADIKEFKIIGYYICEIFNMPEYLKKLKKHISKGEKLDRVIIL